ncbi:MAG: preprotein translocase subunit YajC [Clostridiales bacterium]|nr:MAG: preprotein translocase subunit YajC [Clostridiales bacterium]
MINNLFSSSLILTGSSASSSALGMVAVWGGFFVLLYFFMIRPQKKKQKEVQKMINELTAGTKIVTIGGFVGKIKKVDEEEVTIILGDNEKPVIIKKWAIKTVVNK